MKNSQINGDEMNSDFQVEETEFSAMMIIL